MVKLPYLPFLLGLNSERYKFNRTGIPKGAHHDVPPLCFLSIGLIYTSLRVVKDCACLITFRTFRCTMLQEPPEKKVCHYRASDDIQPLRPYGSRIGPGHDAVQQTENKEQDC